MVDYIQADFFADFNLELQKSMQIFYVHLLLNTYVITITDGSHISHLFTFFWKYIR